MTSDDQSRYIIGQPSVGTHAPVLSPYRTVLMVLAILAFAVGGILLLVGFVAANSPSPLGRGDALSGFPQLLWGGSIAALGFITLVTWLAVSAITNQRTD